MKPTIIFCDFDGTVFDPDVRLLAAPFFNQKTAQLMERHGTQFVITTGRYSWGPWTKLNYTLMGMRRPDFIISGAGTVISKRVGDKYVKDAEWDKRIADAFDKIAVQKKLSGLLKELKVTEHHHPNPYMVIVKLYKRTLNQASDEMDLIADHLKEFDVKVILSEQLFLPNSKYVYNGYALIVPKIAGKDSSSQHILDYYEKKFLEKPTMLSFGDASVDIPLLTMKPHNVTQHFSYGLHLTPLARNTLALFREEKRVHTVPTLLEGSAPQSIYKVLRAYYESPRNSPYRNLLKPFEALIDKTIYPKLTPNELTYKGLSDVRRGLKKGGLRGFVGVTKGHIMDAADGIRARRNPHLKTADGQLHDVYADRTKEFESLVARNQPQAALSCILPSIARAQAEALGIAVSELDEAGGSALSRTRRLLTSLFLYTIGLKSQSKAIDSQIEQANMATFHNRKHAARDFSWSLTKLKSYDRASLERLLLLVEMLQTEYKQVSEQKDNKTAEEYREYLAVNVSSLRKSLKLTQPALAE